MNYTEVTVRYAGWFLFCPIYMEDTQELASIPRYNMWWLLDLALALQQGINWTLSWFNPEATGFWVVVKPTEPFKVRVPTDEEDPSDPDMLYV